MFQLMPPCLALDGSQYRFTIIYQYVPFKYLALKQGAVVFGHAVFCPVTRLPCHGDVAPIPVFQPYCVCNETVPNQHSNMKESLVY